MLKTSLKLTGIASLIIGCVCIYHLFFTPKVGYVEIQKVFNGFEMKKELQEKFMKTNAARKKVIDSLSFDLQLLAQKLRDKKSDADLLYLFELKKKEFYKKQTAFEEDNSVLSNQYDKQILEQMSQYVMEYGKENKYSIIYGTEGNGSLMYATEEFNISDEVIQYINNKYSDHE
jgi:outer membrane protein